MSDTPETDAEVAAFKFGKNGLVRVSFARRLECERDAYKRDAERYRWLRSAGWFDDAIMDSERMNELFPDTIDAAIDAAMRKVGA